MISYFRYVLSEMNRRVAAGNHERKRQNNEQQRFEDEHAESKQAKCL